jgi:hypothetical protein
MTVHQRTGELLRPSDVAEVAAALSAARGGERAGFDIAVNAVRAPNAGVAARQVRALADAGATWWVELAPDPQDGGPDAYRARIRGGPPAG